MDMQEKIEQAFAKITTEKVEIFEQFRELLLEYNQKYNLTSILEKQDIYYKHFLDSAVGADFFKENATVAEIGSGAGFPSIVLKILRPDLKFSLFESVGKKCEFLNVAVDKLGLKNVNIYNIRAEEASRDKKFRDNFDYVTARAVARMNSLSEYCLPFVKLGGQFISYKSGEVDEEVASSKSAVFLLGGKIKDIVKFELGESGRSFIIIDKVKGTPKTYPRKAGTPSKKPL
jgi:16S rRNA (guanine527-N7)-methyltransferase